MSRGLFVSLEGSEGCGKSTQSARLVERLQREGYRVRALREPGGTPLGEEIRHTLKHSPAGHGMTPEAELLLMNAARAQLVREVIRPALEAGDVVVCDRFLDSTVAYQGWGRCLDPDRVRQILDFAVGGTIPDLTLLLEVPTEVSALRRLARESGTGGVLGGDRFEQEDTAFFERVTAGFRAIAAAEPGRVVVIDASPSVDVVTEHVWMEVAAKLSDLSLNED
jgi:dTMP kinase